MDSEAAELRNAATAKAVDLIVTTARSDESLITHLGQELSIEDPGVLVGLANPYDRRGHKDAATMLFERYLRLVQRPNNVGRVMGYLKREWRVRGMRLALMLEREGRARTRNL